MRRILTILCLPLLMGLCGCSEKDTDPRTICDKSVLIDAELYKIINVTNYSITKASISGDCLEISFGASGCDGKSWVVELVDAGFVAESFPCQRFIKLSLINNELCTAALGKTISFDITSLRTKCGNKVKLVLAGSDEPLLYQY